MPKTTFTFEGMSDLVKKLDKISDVYPIMKETLYDGAGILADEIKKRAPDVVKKSIAISKMDSGGGKVNTAVVFAGYDESHTTSQFPNGVPYALIAAAYESGTSERSTKLGYGRGSMNKHPFVRPAMKACEKRASQAMQKKLDEKINDIMEG